MAVPTKSYSSTYRLYNLPQYHANTHRYIQRVLGAPLRYLDAFTGEDKRFITHAVHLITKDDRELLLFIGKKCFQRSAVFCLLHRDDRVAIFRCLLQSFRYGGKMLPGNTVFCAKCRFVNVPVRWRRRKAGQKNTLYSEGICSPECRAYIMHAAYIVEHHDDVVYVRVPGCFCSAAAKRSHAFANEHRACEK